MLTIFRNSLSRSRGTILGWGISLAILGIYVMSLYDAVLSQQDVYNELMKAYPPELIAMFGDYTRMTSPSGYLNFTTFSYASLIIGFLALWMGSGLLVADEEKGTLDLVLAHPVSRAGLFLGRVCAMLLSLGLVLVLCWLGFLVILPNTQMAISGSELFLPFLSLFSVLIFFATLSLLFSLILPSHRLASTLSGLVLVASYLVVMLQQLDEDIESIARFSPFYYYQGGNAINGLNWGWFGGLIGISLVFVLMAGLRFERRDIRVGGEGGWNLDGFFGRKKPVKQD